MVFSCRKCNARYRIDEKLFEKKAIRFSCRKCGQVHLLKDPALGGESVLAIESDAPFARSTQSQPALVPGASGPRGGAGHPPARGTLGTTALPSVPTRGTVEMASAFSTPGATGPGASPRAEDLWFAIRKGQRIGPFVVSGLAEQLRAGVLHERSFVWRPTMESWTRIHQVPELAGMLAAYREWAAAQKQDHTVVAPSPVEPSHSVSRPTSPPAAATRPEPPADRAAPHASSVARAVGGGTADRPPELPQEASSPSASSRHPSSASPLPARPAGGMVDGLFGSIERPALDLRRAEQVQEDEPPPLPPVRPPAHSGAAPRPTVEARAREEGVPPEPPPAPRRPSTVTPRQPSTPIPRQAQPPPQAMFPSQAPEPASHEGRPPAPEAEAEAEQRFFARPVMMPQQDWPKAPGEISWPVPAAGGTTQAPVSRAGAQASHGPSQNLQEFSLLIRLGKKSRRNAFIALIALGGALFLAIGVLVGYTVLEPGPAPGPAPVAEEEAPPVPVAPSRPAPQPSRIEAPPEREWVRPGTGSARARGESTTPANGEGMATSNTGGGQKEKPVPVDPSVKHEFDRFGALLADGGADKQEVKVEVKPRTLTEMPKNTLSKAGMDAFMNSKMRKFAECKGRMTHQTDMPVKVGLSFNVDADGRVTGVEVEQSGARDEGLDQCIRRIVTSWAFPPPEEATTFRTTLLL